jgi:hypothetical protein
MAELELPANPDLSASFFSRRAPLRSAPHQYGPHSRGKPVVVFGQRRTTSPRAAVFAAEPLYGSVPLQVEHRGPDALGQCPGGRSLPGELLANELGVGAPCFMHLVPACRGELQSVGCLARL